MENEIKSLADKIQENINEVSHCEKVESNNEGPAVGDADKVRKSSCEQTRGNALWLTSPTDDNTEKDENGIDERTTSVGSKGSDKVASNHKPNNGYDGITNVQVFGLVEGIKPKKSDTGNNGKTVHQYDKTTLRSREKTEGDLTKGKTMFSRVSSKTRTACFRERK